MACDCSQLDYGALLMMPLECKTIMGPFKQDFVLSDVLFDLYNHPNGTESKACGFVWNVLPNQWSRLLFGGTVNDQGRQYHLESGILCPKDSYLDICSCWFPDEPTALFSARTMGCSCKKPHKLTFKPVPFPKIHWKDIGLENALDPLNPTGESSKRQKGLELVRREAVSSATDVVESGELKINAKDREIYLHAGASVAFYLDQPTWSWSCHGMRDRSGRAPKGTNLVVARRSADGKLLHWAMYIESTSQHS